MEVSVRQQIEQQAAVAAEQRALLENTMSELKLQLDQVHAQFLDALRLGIQRFREERDKLSQLVAAHPEAFREPKSLKLHGWAVGFRKTPGTYQVPDEARTLALIEKKLPELASVLIAVKRSVALQPLAQLDKKQLRAIGVRFDEGGDQPFCRSAGADVERLVAAIIGREQVEATPS